MKVVIAPDSFKGSLTAIEAAESIKKGILKAADWEMLLIPLADGGEGTSSVVAASLGAKSVKIKALDALGGEISAEYFMADEVAVMEMSAASGIILIPRDKLNPLKASTYGTG
ncbi:MAG: glycerate kinase, partial [Monoglobales bacterium]